KLDHPLPLVPLLIAGLKPTTFVAFVNHQLLSFQIAAVKVTAILVVVGVCVTRFLSAAFHFGFFGVLLLLWPIDSPHHD
ncbi:MAG TPA: hypothetical protein VLQ90_13995, partial [Pyrinomonadaceae bacterium]|nr:hypothetical protein [Pyrinomonadaceae bacterium]